MRRLIVVNPAKRLTAEQIMSHPWVAQDAALIPNQHLAATMDKMKKFVARRRLKKAMQAVRLMVRMKLLMAASWARNARARGEDPYAAFFAGAQHAELRDARMGRGGGGGGGDTVEFPSALTNVGRGTAPARGAQRSRVAGVLPTPRR